MATRRYAAVDGAVGRGGGAAGGGAATAVGDGGGGLTVRITFFGNLWGSCQAAKMSNSCRHFCD